MIKSKAWDWSKVNSLPWEEPAGEVYPLLKRWRRQGFKRVLDLGCGIGRHSILFAQNNFNVDATDLSADGIKKLNKLAKENKLNITTTVADMLSLPYENISFNCLIAFYSINHTDDTGIEKTISEIDRVLKSTGEAFITFNSKNSSSYKDPTNKHLTKNTIIKTKGIETGIPHYYANKEDVQRLVKTFEIIEFYYKEEYETSRTGAHYYVLVKKK